MTAAAAGFECGSEVERARAAARRKACNEDHESVLHRRDNSRLSPSYPPTTKNPCTTFSERMNVLIVGLSYGARIVLSYTLDVRFKFF